jgi:hypothetical protein
VLVLVAAIFLYLPVWVIPLMIFILLIAISWNFLNHPPRETIVWAQPRETEKTTESNESQPDSDRLTETGHSGSEESLSLLRFTVDRVCSPVERIVSLLSWTDPRVTLLVGGFGFFVAVLLSLALWVFSVRWVLVGIVWIALLPWARILQVFDVFLGGSPFQTALRAQRPGMSARVAQNHRSPLREMKKFLENLVERIPTQNVIIHRRIAWQQFSEDAAL